MDAPKVRMTHNLTVSNFNDDYLHSALAYKTPNAFEKENFEKGQAILNPAA